MNSRRTTLCIESLEARRLLSGNAGSEPQRDAPPLVAHIVGGDVTNQDWPMMVSLADRNGHFCGGTLIASDIVVTAGHCVDDVSAENLSAVMGRPDLSETEGESIQAAEVILHPEFDAQHGFDADLAIVRLTAPSMYDSVPIVRLQDRKLTTPGSAAIALGWGALDNSFNPAFPTKLHRVDVPIVSNAVANEPHGYDGRITQRMLPAGAAGKDTCGGDSGGPLLVHGDDAGYLLAGVTSFGRTPVVAWKALQVSTHASHRSKTGYSNSSHLRPLVALDSMRTPT